MHKAHETEMFSVYKNNFDIKRDGALAALKEDLNKYRVEKNMLEFKFDKANDKVRKRLDIYIKLLQEAEVKIVDSNREKLRKAEASLSSVERALLDATEKIKNAGVPLKGGQTEEIETILVEIERVKESSRPQNQSS